jgi:DNA (cytosine-5)-methyltransferase 1
VERNEYRRRVLARHFPDTPIHDDVTTYRAHPGEADLIVGGPPCQETSIAAAIHGKKTGHTLWPAMREVIEDVGSAAWVVVEQPVVSPAWEATVAGDLAGLGYRTLRLELSASDFGAPHRRRRVFLLAHRDLSRLQVAGAARSRTVDRLARGAAPGNPWRAGVPRGLRVADGVPGGLDRRERIEAIGDSNPPIMMTAIGLMIREAGARDG